MKCTGLLLARLLKCLQDSLSAGLLGPRANRAAAVREKQRCAYERSARQQECTPGRVPHGPAYTIVAPRVSPQARSTLPCEECFLSSAHSE